MALESSSCTTGGSQPPVVRARISLGAEQSNVALSDGVTLSEKLVELKRWCMDCIGSHLLRHNATAVADSIDDPFQEDISAEEDGEEEEEGNPVEEKVSLSNPKKRK